MHQHSCSCHEHQHEHSHACGCEHHHHEGGVNLGGIKIGVASVLLAVAWAVEAHTSLPTWALLLVYLVPYLVVGTQTLREAVEELFSGHLLGENFLMSIATIGALVIGFLPGAEHQFPEAVFVMLFFQVGELFEHLAEGRSRKSIAQLMDIRPDVANVERDGRVQSVNPADVAIGETIIVKPGERIPLDGEVTDGESSLDTVALTGESVPRSVKVGESVISGCVNISGVLRVRTTKSFGESTASKVLQLVENASEGKSRSEGFIRRFARIYTPVVVACALVVAFADRYSASGRENPAKEAGLRLGDLIISAAGRPVHSNDDLSAALQTGQGSAVTILYRRGGHEYTAQLTPWADASGVYKAGLWVRDSSAGIGTLTFVDPVAGTFAGLGHPISDVDTGADFMLLSGEIVPVTVTGVRSASPGTAGELRGEFLSDILGIVTGNDATGLYGRWTAPAQNVGTILPIAAPGEVHTGDAELWTTLSGRTAQHYTVRIERVGSGGQDANRDLTLRITDPALLSATGGIVQGMSGSPLLPMCWWAHPQKDTEFLLIQC